MTNTRLVAALLLALATLPTSSVHAQIGGLIKKKVGDRIQGPDKKNENQPAADHGPPDSKLGRKLSDVVLTSFKRGLEVERDQRQAMVKTLASLKHKTQEEYRACTQTAASSPEMQKIMLSLGDLPANATMEQTKKASEKIYASMAKLSVDKCGEDPEKFNNAWRYKQIADAELAGVKAFSDGLGSTSGGGGPFLAFEIQPDRDLDFYRLLKEWVPPFCRLSKDAQQAAAEKGVSVPGSGKGIAYVYSTVEAKLLLASCATLMPLIEGLQ